MKTKFMPPEFYILCNVLEKGGVERKVGSAKF